jgi:UDP-glucuronate decarboxylase
MLNQVVAEEIQIIHQDFAEKGRLKNSTVLVTGCAGFLGYYMMLYLVHYASQLGIKKIIGLDNFMLNRPVWIDTLRDGSRGMVEIESFDLITGNIADVSGVSEANFVLHMASIASPTFYRRYPIKTLDANVWGLRKLLEYYKDTDLRGFLFFSSSEVYGNPFPEFIPTHEEYLGNVASIGPRACYDEAKRFGETICYLFATQYNLPIAIVRPFNNYGPGMRLQDKRLPADFAKAVLNNQDIVIYSDGTPTRTFCYITDAITGYLKALVFGKFEYFNIGIDKPEISVGELAEIYIKKGREITGYTGKVRFSQSMDPDYLKHNPSRRCPNIGKARKYLDYCPRIEVESGVGRFLTFLKQTGGIL